MTALTQISKRIPRNLIPRIAHVHGVDNRARSFTPVSDVLALMFSQLNHAIGINDIWYTLKNHFGVLSTIKDASPPIQVGKWIFLREQGT